MIIIILQGYYNRRLQTKKHYIGINKDTSNIRNRSVTQHSGTKLNFQDMFCS